MSDKRNRPAAPASPDAQAETILDRLARFAAPEGAEETEIDRLDRVMRAVEDHLDKARVTARDMAEGEALLARFHQALAEVDAAIARRRAVRDIIREDLRGLEAMVPACPAPSLAAALHAARAAAELAITGPANAAARQAVDDLARAIATAGPAMRPDAPPPARPAQDDRKDDGQHSGPDDRPPG